MSKNLLFLLLIATAHGDEINLGTLGAKGKFKRFGTSYQLNEKEAYEYLTVIGQRRNDQILRSIGEAPDLSNKVIQAEQELLECIYEK